MSVGHQQRAAVVDVLRQPLPFGSRQFNLAGHDHHRVGVDGPPAACFRVRENHVENVAKHARKVHLVGAGYGAFTFATNRVVCGPEVLFQHSLMPTVAKAVLMLVPILEGVGPERSRFPTVGIVHEKRDGRERMAAIRLRGGQA